MAEYTVQSGDTLGKIALARYGTMTAWPRLWEANKAVIENELEHRYGRGRFNPYRMRPWDGIFPGTVLRIPDGGNNG